MIVFSVIYFLLAIICFGLVYSRTLDILHPIGVMTFMWFATAGISALKLGTFQTDWAMQTHILIILSGLICLGVTIFSLNRKNDYGTEVITISDSFRIFSRIIFFVSLLIILRAFISSGFNINSFSAAGGFDKKGTISDSLSGISSIQSYVMIYFPFCALNSIFEVTYSEKDEKAYKYNIFVLIIVVLYCSRVIYSRGTLLYVMLGAIYIIHSKYNIKTRYIILMAIGVVLALFIVMQNRVDASSLVYRGVSKSPFINSTYNYIAYCFQNFDAIVKNGSRYKIFANVWQSVYKIFGVYNPSDIIQHETSIYNALTYLSSFYDDLGFIGTLIYPALISLFLNELYNKSNKNNYLVLVLSTFQKAIFVCFFGNYFLGSFSTILPYLITGILCYLSRRLSLKMKRIKFVVNVTR